jgi:hypothetical protein
MKLTEWYPSHILPVRHGVYKTKHYYKNINNSTLQVKIGYSYWSGHWGYTTDLETATKLSGASQMQNKQWQGVTNEHQNHAD